MILKGNMKYLITGISGFVAGHYLEYLLKREPGASVAGIDISRPDLSFLNFRAAEKIKFYKGTLLNADWVTGLLRKIAPDYILHFASYSSVAYSWKNPAESFLNNTNIFLNLAEAARKVGLKSKILSIGSSECYGVVNREDLPITEKHALRPLSPYAVARVSQEELCKIYAANYGTRIICTRSFNHIGPRQSDIFAVSSFARQAVEARKGKRGRIICGDLGIVRDVMDVRDVVRAYDLLLKKGKIGEIYNVCSGKGHKLGDILKSLLKKAKVKVPVRSSGKLVRPADNPVIIGSPAKLRKDTAFVKKITLSNSLEDMLEYWENKLKVI